MWSSLGLRETNGFMWAGFNAMNEVKDRFLGAILSKPRTELRGPGRCVHEEVSPEEKVKNGEAKGGIVGMHLKVLISSDS